MIVSPSFLTADFSALDAEIRSIHTAPWLHFDVMDGKFVPAVTYDEAVVRRLKAVSGQFFDVHLMIEQPERTVRAYARAGADSITFHQEATADPGHVIRLIRDLGKGCGISLKPATPAEALVPWLDQVDLVLVMSVEPGKGGQKFLPSALEKIRFFAAWRDAHRGQFRIEVDGGINAETAPLVREAGADVLVAGSFVFNREDREAAISELEHA